MDRIAKGVAAIAFFALSFIGLVPLGAGLGNGAGLGAALCGALFVVSVVILAPNGRRAWGRGFMLDGALFVAMPLLVLPLLGRAFADTVDNAPAYASVAERSAHQLGAGIGVSLALGAASFVGLTLGLIFLIFGLVLSLGGKREVVIARD